MQLKRISIARFSFEHHVACSPVPLLMRAKAQVYSLKSIVPSLTLFIEAGGGQLLESALQRWFGGEMDQRTLRLLEAGSKDG